MPGIIFDGRSMILSVSGLFGGPIVAGVAAVMTAAYRLWLGGPGAFVGVSVILESAGLGVIFYYIRRRHPKLTRNLYLFAFCLLVQVGRLLLMLMLPEEGMLQTLEHMAMPVLVIFPAATWLICLLFLDEEAHVSAEEAIRKSEERYRIVADFTNDWEYWIDAEGNFLYCSPSCERITGYSPKDFLVDPDLMNRIIHPDDLTATLDHYHNVRKLAPYAVDAMDFRIIRRDGATRWIGHVCQPVYGQDGQPLGRRGSNRDMTVRKRAEENNLRFAAIIESSDDAIIGKTLDGTITSWNRGAERIYGYKEHEVVGRPITILAPHDREDEIQGILEQIKSGESIQHVETVRRNNIGENIPVSLTISRIIDKEGRITGLSTISRDISDRVKAAQQREALQEQLFQAQKMEAIGTLAGGFAHDFNNKLQVIDGCVELILFNKDLPETIKPDLEIMKQAINICSELIKGMMVFSRKTPVEFQPIELNKLVAQTRSMLTRSIPTMIEIDLLLADDLWTINASLSQIDQILMNLAVNAKDAMPDGGRLTIRTRNITLDDEFLRPYPHTKPGRYVLLSVTDSGNGIDQETVKHIFEPFFTTKEPGKGTGLGLSVVYGIVEKHGGMIVCDSRPSVGTTFRIYFPAIEVVPQEQYTQKKKPLRGQGETILVVDDEAHITEFASRMLAKANYRVITASNGKEALELYEKHQEEVKLVILDLIMPEMGGEECLRALLTINPGVRVLVVSGDLKEGMADDLKVAGAKGVIKKPFDVTRLLENIRKIIDEE
jgi:PAS domain S-box-containing protein